MIELLAIFTGYAVAVVVVLGVLWLGMERY